MSIFHRYLQALQCPIIDQINDQSIHQPSTQELLLLWLEDRKIREFEIEDRVPLRLSKHNGDLQTWSSHINKYGEAIGCPYEWVVQGSNSKYIPDANKQFLFWLASRAIALDYEDTVETDEVTSCNNHDINSGEEVMEIDEDLKDENYQRIVQKCEKLGGLVGIQRKQGEPIVEFVRRIVQKVKFSSLSQQSYDSNLSLQDFPLAQETTDPLINQIALVLRMLYLSDFRELQNEVNDLIILGQEYTANPRLNTTLGKVGR